MEDSSKAFQHIPLFEQIPLEPQKLGADESLLKIIGTTYSMAQAVRWLDDENFAIGRWDGTLTIFHRPKPDGAPVVSDALVAPSLAGVEMIARIRDHIFASSNDRQSIAVWSTGKEFENGVSLLTLLQYDPKYGAANDGTTTAIDNTIYFVTGHAEGWVLVWHADDDNTFTLIHAIDVRSQNPIPSPYPLRNVRGVERWNPGLVVSGSEDGDLCLIDVKTGLVITRERYNQHAERGINDIDTCGDYLLVANCSVGSNDKNIWLYRIQEDKFMFLDSKNLRVDGSAPQVFNFCVDQIVYEELHYFVAATQEGVVWVGRVEQDALNISGNHTVSTKYGAALALEPTSALLAVAGDNLHLFKFHKS